MARAKRIPGEPDQAAASAKDATDPTTEPTAEPTLEAEPQGRDAIQFATGDEAAAYFEANPEAPRRAVLTKEGWYVPPEYGTPPAVRGK